MPESQEINQRRRSFALEHEPPDQATMESFFKLQMKQTLQRSALSHLLAIDEESRVAVT
jgi:hypothetical protein